MVSKITGSTTGYTFKRVGNDIECYDASGKKIDKSVFLAAEGLELNSEGKFVKKGTKKDATGDTPKTKGKKVNLTEADKQNLQHVSGNYYYKFANGKVSYYCVDGSTVTQITGEDFKAATGGYVKKDGKFITQSDATKATTPKKKASWIDKGLAFSKGMVKSVTKMFTDENGKFSWKQTAKTVVTCAAVVTVAAVAVAAGVVTGGTATALIVGAGVAMGGANILKGALNLSSAETDEEKLAAWEQMGEGTGEVGMAILTKRPMASSMKAVSAAAKAEKMAALASGSGRAMATVKGVGAGVKTVLPSPKQIGEGVKTAYDAVRHPVKTTRNAINGRRARVNARENITHDVETVRTQEDFVAARERVNNSEALSPKEKAKLNKKLDKMNREELPHEDLATLRERANDTSLSAKERTAAQKEYEAALKRSTDRATLEKTQNEGVSEFNGVDEAGFRTKVEEADPSVNNDALINAIKKSDTLSAEVKTELLGKLETKGVKISERGQIIETRLAEITKMQETEFNSLISQAELKPLTRSQKALNRVKTKNHKTQSEYDTIKSRIETEVTDPKLKANLLKKLEAKQKLLDDIDAMRPHPELKEYKDLLGRAEGDEYALSLLEKKLASDHSSFNTPKAKIERSKLYKEIYKEQHKINPEKYPDIEMRVKAQEEKNLIKNAEKELADIKKEIAKAERKANPEKVQEELTAAENRLNETETTLRNELAELKRTRSHENATNGTRQSEINQALRDIEAQKAEIAAKRAEIESMKTRQEQYEEGMSELNKENQSEITARERSIGEQEAAIEELHKENAFLDRQQELYRSQREFLDETYQRQAAGEIKQGKNGIVEELQAKETSVQSEIDAMQAKLDGLKEPKKGLFESKGKFAERQAEYNTQKAQLEEQISMKKYEKAEWAELRETAENSTQSSVHNDLDITLRNREMNVAEQRQINTDNIAARERTIEGLKDELQYFEQKAVNNAATAEQVKADYEATTQRLNQEIETISERITQTESNVRTLENERTAYREKVSRTNEEINSKKSDLKDLQKETNPDKVKIKKLQEELADLQRNHDTYQAKLDELNTKLAKKQAKLERLKKSQTKKREKLRNVHKAGGAFLAGVTGTQAVQEIGRNVDQVRALLAAMEMDEGEATEEDMAEEAIEEAIEETEVAEEESASETPSGETPSGETPSGETPSGETPSGETPASGSSQNPQGPSSTGGDKTPKVDNKTNNPTQPENKTNNPTQPEDKTTKPVDQDNSSNPTVQDDNNVKKPSLDVKEKPEGVTLQNYVSGRDANGNIREITPAERMLITQQLEHAQTIEDIALMYEELRSFKKFEGRKNLLKAIKQKRNQIEGKKNKYHERFGKIQDSKVYKSDVTTVGEHPEQKATTYSSADLGNVTVAEKKKPFFRRIFGGGDYNPYLVTGGNPEKITLDVPPNNEGSTTPDIVVNQTGDDGIKTNPDGIAPEGQTGGDGTPTNPEGVPEGENQQEITVPENNPGVDEIVPDPITEDQNNLMAAADPEEDKPKLDISDGWGLA